MRVIAERVTAEYLESKGACKDGVVTFRQCFPGGLGWTLEGQLAVLRSDCHRYLGCAAIAGWVPLFSMAEIDLRGTNLQGADLRGTNLQDAILRKADIQDADLRKANLQGADIQDALLRGALLQDADLRWSDLRGADLRWANLQRVDLRGADLRGASLQDADIDDVLYDFATRWPEGFDAGRLRR